MEGFHITQFKSLSKIKSNKPLYALKPEEWINKFLVRQLPLVSIHQETCKLHFLNVKTL